MKKSVLYIVLTIFITSVFSCKKDTYTGKDINKLLVNNYNNETGVSIDSLEAIKQITNQKIQEVYDLGLLMAYNKDLELDSILTKQMNNYFMEKDSNNINMILNDVKNSKSNYIKIQNIEKITKDSLKNDSVGISKFLIKYYNKEKKYLSQKNKYVKYILKKKPTKFKSEFKFYFIKFSENDSTLNGEIK